MSLRGYEIISGIYFIECVSNGKLYIGSSVNIHSRFDWHKCKLRANKHSNSMLQNAWNKYGENDFIFEIVEKTISEETLKREQIYLDLYKDEQGNFNKYRIFNVERKSTFVPRIAGNAEWRRKVSETKKGKPLSAATMEGNKRWREANKEAIANISKKKIILISPTGEKVEHFGIKDFCKKYNLEPSCLHDLRKGTYKQHKGWTLPKEINVFI